MRLRYPDESLWIPVADGLRRRGWSVYTVREGGKLGDPGRDHRNYALEHDRILGLTLADLLGWEPRHSWREASGADVPNSTV